MIDQWTTGNYTIAREVYYQNNDQWYYTVKSGNSTYIFIAKGDHITREMTEGDIKKKLDRRYSIASQIEQRRLTRCYDVLMRRGQKRREVLGL